MTNQNDLSRSVVAFEQHNTIIVVIEMSLSSWLVAGMVPGIERHPLKKLNCDQEMLLKLLFRWRDEAVKAGHTITRIVVAFGRLLVSPLAAGPRHRSSRHSPDERCRFARASPSQDGPARH